MNRQSIPGPDGGLIRWDADPPEDTALSRDDAEAVIAAVALVLWMAVLVWQATRSQPSLWGIALCVLLGVGCAVLVARGFRRAVAHRRRDSGHGLMQRQDHPSPSGQPGRRRRRGTRCR